MNIRKKKKAFFLQRININLINQIDSKIFFNLKIKFYVFVFGVLLLLLLLLFLNRQVTQ